MRNLSTKTLIWSIANTCVLVLGFASLGTVSAKNNKMDVCHYQEENDSWKLISVGTHAASTHLENHDDAIPGGTTFHTGTILDSDCIEVKEQCPCDFSAQNFLSLGGDPQAPICLYMRDENFILFTGDIPSFQPYLYEAVFDPTFLTRCDVHDLQLNLIQVEQLNNEQYKQCVKSLQYTAEVLGILECEY